MKTIDEVLSEAAEGLKAEGARTMSDRDLAPKRRRVTFAPILTMSVAALAVLAVIGIPALLLATDQTQPLGSPNTLVPVPTDSSEPGGQVATTVTILDDPANVGPTVLNVSILSTSDPEVPDWGDNRQQVDETLGATGIAYEAYPDDITDAAVKEGRAVIVGGNAARTVGIWYSDNGTWKQATLDLPSWLNIGDSEGDYRLADGIQNVEALDGGFVAWEPVQRIRGGEPGYVGTLVLVSTDGTEWAASVSGEPNAALTDFGEYADGYLATISGRELDGHYTTYLWWASDLWDQDPIDWTSMGTAVDVDGFAHELTVVGSSVYILLGSDDGESANVARVDLG
jgi:hypothetical protein